MAADSQHQAIRSVSSYHLLGRSGLRVSPLCLGTMTFGGDASFGADEAASRAMFNGYREAGGNFFDTADVYAGGRSEEALGRLLKESGERDRYVVATKFGLNARAGDPNGGGNGRKRILEAVEGSLRRLQTDYIDLYYVHAWDRLTPEEELMSALDTLVRAGKARYLGLSNTPAWHVGSCQRLAELRGWERICALQYEYSLAHRDIELEFLPAAVSLGMGMCPWSPLAGGFLTGKYTRDARAPGRLQKAGKDNPAFDRFTERNFAILDAALEVASEIGRTPAQVALNWITHRPGVASTIIGATRPDQLAENLQALEFDIPGERFARLEEVSRPLVKSPYVFFGDALQAQIHGGNHVLTEPAWYRGR